VVVGVTIDASSRDRWRRAEIDVDGGVRTRIIESTAAEAAAPIVVEARAEGFAPTRATVATSTNPDQDSVLVVAARSLNAGLTID